MNQVGIAIELSDGISLTLVFADFTCAMVHKHMKKEFLDAFLVFLR